MVTEPVSPKTQRRFAVENFYVQDVLLGRAHKFRFEGKEVSVKLPTLRQIKASENDPHRKIGRLSESRPGPDGGDREAYYELHEIRVIIQMTESFKVPRKLPPEMATPFDTLSEKEQERVWKAASIYGPIANRAFRKWLRVLRWQTGLGLLGRSIAENYESYEGAKLIDPRTGKTFGTGVHMIKARASQRVTSDHWKPVARRLKRGDEPPIWVDWLLDGQLAHANGNIGGALANYAIACESFLTAKLFEEFPSSIKPEALDVVRGATYGTKILDKYAKKRFTHFKDWGRLYDLFKIRNDVFHKGASPKLSKRECERLGDSVHTLIYGNAP